MVTIDATLYQPDSSKALDVRLDLMDNGDVQIQGAGSSRLVPSSEFRLSDPIGRMARHFQLADGGRLDVQDVTQLAAWESACGRKTGMHFVHLIESRWRWVAAAVLFMAAFTAAGYIWGIPMAARSIAFRLPPKVAELATREAMRVYDQFLDHEPSKLPQEKRDQIDAEFQRIAKSMHHGTDRNYRLRFLSAPMPNAFALPDGLVCMTDKLVEIAHDDREIYGVLAHEIAHVREQHGLRLVLQNSAVFLIWAMMTGDISTVAGMGSALPAILAQSGYSRVFEREADEVASEYMIERGWGVDPLCNLLKRIDPELMDFGEAGEAISSHPLTAKRIDFMQTLARRRSEGPVK